MKAPVSVIGLGKLGAPLLACMCRSGRQVLGLDVDSRLVNLIGQGLSPFPEPLLAELLAEHRSLIRTTTSYAQAIQDSQVSFIIVPTPSDAKGAFSTSYLRSAVQSLGQQLRNKPHWHLFVITSTVLPNSIEGDIIPILEAASGKKCGLDFGVCYSPLFIALGSVVSDILNPDFVLIGESDRKSGDCLEEIYRDVTKGKAQVARMNFVNAELAKISVNSFVTLKISFANQLAELCEHLPGADADTVAGALGLDSRIGPKYLKGGLGYGGPCFPRDNQAFHFLAKQVGVEANTALVADRINERQPSRILGRIAPYLDQAKQVAILGLAYKPHTGVIEGSQAISLAQELLDRNIEISAYDPLAMENARSRLGDRLHYARSVGECVRDADVILITLPLEQFRLRPSDLAPHKRPLIFDCWRLMADAPIGEIAHYLCVGRPTQEERGGR